MNNNKNQARQIVKQGQGSTATKDKAAKSSQQRGTKRSRAAQFKASQDNEKVSARYARSSSDNDISWYSKNPELLKAAGSFGFSYTTGAPLPFPNSPSLPGLMTLGWSPFFNGAVTDAINISADSVYSYVVHANSRNTSYSAKDLMILILAGAQVYSALSFAIRAYGIMRSYSQLNDYMPKALVRAMGLNFNDLQSNLSKMWFDINALIASAGQIWIPNDLPIITRWFWLNANIYMDADSIKGQMYMFVPSGFLKYDDSDFRTGGALVPATFPTDNPESSETQFDIFNPSRASQNFHSYESGGYTWQQLYDTIAGMIESLRNSTDRGIMFGDILKAYGMEHIYGMSEIPVDYRIYPVYNPEVLTQIENCIGYGNKDFIMGVYQNMETNSLDPLYDAAVTAYNDSFPRLDKTVLNFHHNANPTPEEIMIATRLHISGWDAVNGEQFSFDKKTGKFSQVSGALNVVPVSAGTEIVTDIKTWFMAVDSAGARSLQTADSSSFSTNPSLVPLLIQNKATFDWAPLSYQAGTTTEPYTHGFYGNVENMCVVTPEAINRLHHAAILSEFNVPTI